MAAGDTDRAYWDTIAVVEDGLPSGWRHHAREQHLALIRRWVPVMEGRWLKTDLYEERDVDRALLPYLGGASWIGLDLSPELLRIARPSGSVLSGVAADVRCLPLADASIDGIVSTSTLDHFDHRRHIVRALTELRRVLRDGGQLVLTLDNPRNPLIRARNALPQGVARRTGLVPFSVGETMDEADGRRALVGAGFEIRAVEHLLHAPHVVGTRLAAFEWYEHRVLPRFAALGRTRIGPWTGHYVAFHAVATP